MSAILRVLGVAKPSTSTVAAPRQEVLNSLAEDPDFTGEINTFIKTMLKHYPVNGTLPFAAKALPLLAAC